MFKDSILGSTHYEGDGCGIKEHNKTEFCKKPCVHYNCKNYQSDFDTYLKEKCGFMILTPHYDNGHNGGMWCAAEYPCKRHGVWKVSEKH